MSNTTANAAMILSPVLTSKARLRFGQDVGAPSSTAAAVGAGLAVAGAGLGAYHGYRRDNSVGWAIWWAAMGGLFPVITTAIAVAQGFGQRR
jgi:hypothetical protein